MNKSIAILLASLLVATSNNLHAASIWDNLKKRVGKEVENVVTGKVARKAGDKAGEATDAVLNPSSDQVGDEQASADSMPKETSDGQGNADANNPLSGLGGLGGLGGMLSALQEEVPIDESYAFDFSVNATMVSDGEKSTMKQRYSDSAFLIETDKRSQIIMDLNNQAIIMLDEKAKTKTPMSMKLIQQMSKMGGSRLSANSVDSVDIAGIKKTGETKKIAGQSTEQWVFEDEGRRGEVWFASNVDFDFVDFTKRLSKTFGGEQSRAAFDFSSLEGDYPQGVIMESKTYVNGKLESEYLVTKLKRKSTKINLSKYQTKSLMEGGGS